MRDQVDQILFRIDMMVRDGLGVRCGSDSSFRPAKYGPTSDRAASISARSCARENRAERTPRRDHARSRCRPRVPHVVSHVAGEMERQRARGIRHSRHRLPELALVGVGFDLPSKRSRSRSRSAATERTARYPRDQAHDLAEASDQRQFPLGNPFGHPPNDPARPFPIEGTPDRRFPGAMLEVIEKSLESGRAAPRRRCAGPQPRGGGRPRSRHRRRREGQRDRPASEMELVVEEIVIATIPEGLVERLRARVSTRRRQLESTRPRLLGELPRPVHQTSPDSASLWRSGRQRDR